MRQMSDWLNQSENQTMLNQVREKLLNQWQQTKPKHLAMDSAPNTLDPEKLESEVQQQQLGIREILMQEAPNEFLGPLELEDREARAAATGSRDPLTQWPELEVQESVVTLQRNPQPE